MTDLRAAADVREKARPVGWLFAGRLEELLPEPDDDA